MGKGLSMNVNILLFDDFETLDAFGPAQVFGKAPDHFYMNYLSVNGGIINSAQGVKVWTEPLEPEKIKDILILPGGRGTRKFLRLEEENLALIQKAAKYADLCLMVGNGSDLLAQSGLLFRRRIADYDYDENWKRMFTAGIQRIPGMRCMADGKYYSSSSSAAGIDMALAVVADMVDIDVAERIAKRLGYVWDADSEDGILM